MNQMRHFNRELSWLAFNQRVLHECLDSRLVLSERLKFCAIFSNNLDEFFMIRVSGLIDQVFAGYQKRDFSGMKPIEQLRAIRGQVEDLVKLQSEIAQDLLQNQLPLHGIQLVEWGILAVNQKEALERYFVEHIFPVLTPMAVDFSRPFPLVLNKSLNLVAKLKGEDERYVTIQVPSVIKRLVPVDGHMQRYMLLENVIMAFGHHLFEGYEIEEIGVYRVTRSGDLNLKDEIAEDLLGVIEASLKQRKWGDVVRLEVNAAIEPTLLKFLVDEFEIEEDSVYHVDGPLDLTWLFNLSEEMRKIEGVAAYKPKSIQFEASIFEEIQKRDLFFHHPFDSFDPVVEFIKSAAKDPEVLAIKQVLYRVGGDSPIVKALQDAANRGKQVTVLVELLARFDEENNIHWAKSLEKHGCHVIYGLSGIKTHAKITLVVRNEADGICRYVHLSTGNYNDKTAKIYTDLSLFTCHEQIAQDASKFFNILSGYVNNTQMNQLVTAPLNLKKRLIALIEQETFWASQGRPARIMAKMNALVDYEVIEALYAASNAGVKIDLVIRGICCLIPQKPGLSENIRVVSVIGNYLEHSRLFCFFNNGEHLIFIASADWMPRNLFKRIELMTPILDPQIKKQCLNIIEGYLETKAKSRYLMPSGLYVSQITEKGELSMQQRLERLSLIEAMEV